MNIQERYQYWYNHQDLDPKLKEELASLDEKAIEDYFYTDVKFQTAGMRGLMGVGPNRINIHTIRKATMGFIGYLKDKNQSPKVAISYDNRYNSKEFAYDCAKLLASNNIEVYIASDLRPTPELSFMTRYYKCDGGIMITASHNPKEYNGYKLYDASGCQLIPEIAEIIIKKIDKIKDVLAIKPGDYDGSLIHVVDKELDEAYFKAVLDIQLRKDLAKDFVIAFSPEHGASNIPVRETLNRAGYTVVPVLEQCNPDPAFTNTKTPNPEEAGAYEKVLVLAKEHYAELLLVCDPDGDRMGVGVKDKDDSYYIFNGDQTGAILLEYILSTLKEMDTMPSNPCMFNTIVTSDIGEQVAKYYGVECEKTLTGFKYIGDKIAKYDANKEKTYVFGYEESYGSLISPFVRDKDATQACLMLAEACAYYRKENKTLKDVLDDIYARVGVYYQAQTSINLPGSNGAKRLLEIMEKTRKEPIKEIDGIKVYKWEDYEKQKVYENNKARKLKGYDVADVLKYYFIDGSFIAIRPSGTEPKCKVYYSIKDETIEAAKEKTDSFIAYITKLIK